MFTGVLPAVGSPPGVRSGRLPAVLAVQAADAIDDGQECDRAGGQKACAQADEERVVALVDAVKRRIMWTNAHRER